MNFFLDRRMHGGKHHRVAPTGFFRQKHIVKEFERCIGSSKSFNFVGAESKEQSDLVKAG